MSRYSKVIKKRKKNAPALLPETWQVFIARRLIDGTGAVFAVAGLALAAALASYHQADPSWNTASTAGAGAVHNWLGAPGAHIADLLLQTLGLAAILAAITLMVWGGRILKRMTLRPLWVRLAALITALLCGAAALALLPAGPWLPHPYWGGSGGTIIMEHITTLTHILGGGAARIVIAAAMGVIALAAFLYACAVSKAELKTVMQYGFKIIAAGAAFITGRIMAFYDWVRIYGDPDYEIPATRRRAKDVKNEKLARMRAEKPARSAASPATPVAAPALSAEPEPAQPQNSAAIRVAAAAKARGGGDVSGRQTSFALQSARAGDDTAWEFPPLDLLQEAPVEDQTQALDEKALRQNAEMLQNVLADFNVSGEIVSINPGPVVTLYELEPAPGTKSARVIGLSDDIARSMAAISVRCANIPGRNVIGIELPNRTRQTVYMREILETRDVAKTKASLPLILGKDIGGAPIIADLAKMPHLLVAGTTGSGKSVAINTMILSLLYQLPPEKCRFIMIDPKMLELSVYDDIPHLLAPVVTEPGRAVVSLKWAVQEMENRYRAMSRLGVRNIEGYNERLAKARKKGETMMRKVQTGFDPESGKPVYEDQPMDMTELPYIVIVVDEFADLMLVAGKDVENAVQRLAQMARAAGIHLIMATQRPSVDVITGVIKSNFPTRISFQVSSKIDSRTILNEGGAEQLLGMGDMLYMASGGRITRVHGPFVADDEVESVVNFLKAQGEPSYLEDITDGDGSFGDSEVMAAMFGEDGGGNDGSSAVDELYDQAVAIVARERRASTSFIQRHLQIGYNRAARIIEEMERQGVVSKASPTGEREILVGDYSDA